MLNTDNKHKNRLFISRPSKSVHVCGNTMKTLVALLVYLVKTQKLSDQFIQLSFEFRDFYYLNVTRLGTIFVDDNFDCSFSCKQNILCVSFNLAAFADDKGKLRCELLPSTMYNLVKCSRGF